MNNFSKGYYWLCPTIFVLFSFVSIAVYFYYSHRIPAQLIDQVQGTGQLTTNQIQRTISQDLKFLASVRAALPNSKGDIKNWKSDIKTRINNHSEVLFLTLVDQNGDRQTVGENAFTSFSKENCIDRILSTYKVKESDSTKIFTTWSKNKSEKGVLVANLPIFSKGDFKGLLIAAITLKPQLDTIAKYLKDYGFQVENKAGDVIFTNNWPQKKVFNPALLFNRSFKFDLENNESVVFKMLYRNYVSFDRSLIVTRWMLIFGIILSLSLALLLFFYLKSQEAVKKTLHVNEELHQINVELEKERENAQQASLAKSAFLSNMSHEIRTPLHAILGISELLGSDKSHVQQKNYLRLMQESSRTLLALINDVLAIDRIESGKEDLAKDRFEPCAIVDNIISFYAPEIELKNLELHNTIHCDHQNIIIADRTKFEQILINILGNAIKFTHVGSITVVYKEILLPTNRVSLSIEIEDSGIGIPKEKQEAIFERFTQLDDGLKKKHSGSGLGLAITKQLVTHMGGTISLQSEVDKGSKFTVEMEFPLAEEIKKVESSRKIECLNFSHLNVLAVDDNNLNVIILTKLLAKMGMNAEIACNGREAFEKTQTKYFDLIFMDVHMPVMDGFEATRNIRATNTETLILGLSADATTCSIEKGLCAGMNYYLTKPLDQEKLKAILNKTFRKTLNH